MITLCFIGGLHQIQYFIGGLNTLRLIVILSKEKIFSGDIVTIFVKSSDRIADIFTKLLNSPRISYIYDLHAPA